MHPALLPPRLPNTTQDANLAVQVKEHWVGKDAPWAELQAETAAPVYQMAAEAQQGGRAARRLAAAPAAS